MNHQETGKRARAVDILLVEDSGVERLLTMDALRGLRVAHTLHCVDDGEEAMEFLRRAGAYSRAPRPDLILLDLKLPRKNGCEVLEEIKADPALRSIPVVVLSSSAAEEDLREAYGAHANCYLTKPIDLEQFGRVARSLEAFWFEAVSLPPAPGQATGPVAPSATASAPGLCRVLLVEDSPSDAILLESALRDSVSLRFSTERVERLGEALGRLRTVAYDAVVTDLSLPDSEGLETLRRLVRAAGDTPVIVLTAMDDERKGMELLHVGARDCLVKGELGGRALARAVRQAVDRSRMEARLRQAQRMESVGVLAGGVAHDFNNLLTIIRGNAELFSAGASTEVGEAGRRIMAAADRGAALIRQLLAFGRRERLRVRPIELNAALVDFMPMLRRLLRPSIQCEERFCREPLPMLADPSRIEQVVMNLALNAMDAMPQGGRLAIETSRVERTAEDSRPCPPAGPGPYALLTVRDSGEGIPADVLPHVFEPFFTTKPTGRGTGLGLAAVYGLVRQHHGDVEARSDPGRGAEIRVWLPLAASPDPVAELADAGRPVAGETVLLVEAEPLLREMAASGLRKEGYDVVEAGGPVEALSLWEKAGARIGVLLTDVSMPGLSGQDLARLLQGRKPGLRVVFFGVEPEPTRVGTGGMEGVAFLAKPYTLQALNEVVREALAEARSRRRA